MYKINFISEEEFAPYWEDPGFICQGAMDANWVKSICRRNAGSVPFMVGSPSIGSRWQDQSAIQVFSLVEEVVSSIERGRYSKFVIVARDKRGGWDVTYAASEIVAPSFMSFFSDYIPDVIEWMDDQVTTFNLWAGSSGLCWTTRDVENEILCAEKFLSLVGERREKS